MLGSVVYGTMENRSRSININFGVQFLIAMRGNVSDLECVIFQVADVTASDKAECVRESQGDDEI